MVSQVGRPRGITILAVLAAISGILGITGLLAIGGLTFGGLVTILSILLLALSVVMLLLAYGFWNFRAWAWQLGLGVWAVSIVLSVVEVLDGAPLARELISVLLAAGILYYLNTPAVRQAFGRPPTGF